MFVYVRCVSIKKIGKNEAKMHINCSLIKFLSMKNSINCKKIDQIRC